MPSALSTHPTIKQQNTHLTERNWVPIWRKERKVTVCVHPVHFYQAWKNDMLWDWYHLECTNVQKNFWNFLEKWMDVIPAIESKFLIASRECFKPTFKLINVLSHWFVLSISVKTVTKRMITCINVDMHALSLTTSQDNSFLSFLWVWLFFKCMCLMSQDTVYRYSRWSL